MSDFRSPYIESMLERYRGVVLDWPSFQVAHGVPEPVGIRIRGGRVPPEEVADRLRAQGFEVGEAPGIPGLYQIRGGPTPVSRTMEHWLGLFHIQQTVMALPPLALAPRPGERVLDLCAAPGGKTTHLADLMDDRGPLVAVDPKEKRLRGLLANVYRLGHPNVLVVAADGRALPSAALFDRVLVDAPCSAEGTTRRQQKAPKRGPGFAEHVTELQEALLRSAVRLTRPGGTIVYSTCTYAPEENEAVVDRILAEGQVRLEVIPLDLPHDPGLLEWSGTPFHPEMDRGWRVYPHHLDSGGLFMARLRRIGNSVGGRDPRGEGESAGGWSPVPRAFPGEDPDAGEARVREALGYLAREVGFPPELLGSLGWMTRGDNIWAHTAGEWPFPSWEGTPRWRVVSAGIRALKRGSGGRETPSNHFLCRWGDHLPPHRRPELPREEVARLLDGPIPVPGTPSDPSDASDGSDGSDGSGAPDTPDPEAGGRPLAEGPLALSWGGRILGRAIAGRGVIRHEIPKALAAELREVLGGSVSPRE